MFAVFEFLFMCILIVSVFFIATTTITIIIIIIIIAIIAIIIFIVTSCACVDMGWSSLCIWGSTPYPAHGGMRAQPAQGASARVGICTVSMFDAQTFVDGFVYGCSARFKLILGC